MKPHYFDQDHADESDYILGMAKSQGYVPKNCLLEGSLVVALVAGGEDPCQGCKGPREKCGGR
jgi:hypothetical protein